MLTSGAKDLRVQVREAAGCGVCETQHGGDVDAPLVQVVVERATLVVVGDEEQLSPRARPLDVSRDET